MPCFSASIKCGLPGILHCLLHVFSSLPLLSSPTHNSQQLLTINVLNPGPLMSAFIRSTWFLAACLKYAYEALCIFYMFCAGLFVALNILKRKYIPLVKCINGVKWQFPMEGECIHGNFFGRHSFSKVFQCKSPKVICIRFSMITNGNVSYSWFSSLRYVFLVHLVSILRWRSGWDCRNVWMEMSAR